MRWLIKGFIVALTVCGAAFSLYAHLLPIIGWLPFFASDTLRVFFLFVGVGDVFTRSASLISSFRGKASRTKVPGLLISDLLFGVAACIILCYPVAIIMGSGLRAFLLLAAVLNVAWDTGYLLWYSKSLKDRSIY